MLIETTNDLIKYIKTLGIPPYVTIDTEFISEKTYYPQLCLIQLGYGSHAAAIDPLSNLDLEPLITFLRNPKIVKVLHAAFQDLAIFWHDFNLALTPLFDTQVAAMACGFGDQVSYSHLVKTFTNTRLDKSSQIIDWSRRPLLDKHIDYALGDVLNLGPVYEQLSEDINQQGRAGWIKEEMLNLSNPKRYEFDLQAQVKKQKMRNASRRRLAVLHALILWREEQAKVKNIPRGWVLKDLSLRDIVSNPPKNLDQLNRVRGIGGNGKGTLGRELLARIATAEKLPLSECPIEETPKSVEQVNDNSMVLLRSLLKHVCDKNRVAPKLVASKVELEQLSLGHETQLLSGWRWEIYGNTASQLLAGKIALTLKKGDIEIIQR